MSAGGSLGVSWRRLRGAVRQVFGVPDFDRYLEHRRLRHPGEPALSEREFHARALERRYGAGRAGCC